MKLIKQNFKILFFIAIALGMFYGCEKEKEEDVKVSSITIKTPPYKLDYFVGEELQLDGIVATLTMSDGSIKDIIHENFFYEGIVTSPNNRVSLTSGINEVTLIHSESNKKTYQSIVVTDIAVSKIEVLDAPEKTEYIEGEKLDLTGLKIALISNNGALKEIGINDFTLNGITLSVKEDTILNTEITKIEFNHTVSGKKIEQPIIVRDFFGMAMKTMTSKTDYYNGERLDISDIEIVIFIDNTNNQRILKYDEFADYGISTSIKNNEILTKLNEGLVNINITHTISQKSTFITIFFNEFLKDIDGNSYKIIRIKDNVWMAENLRVTKYSDGTSIPLVQDNTAWGNLADNNTSRAYCYYNNNTNNEAETYGAIYTFAAAVNGTPAVTDEDIIQGVCPDGWHVASYNEWRSIGAGLSNGSIDLKGKGDEYWGVGNNGTDKYGFNALPGGKRSSRTGEFENINEEIHWWGNSEAGNNRDARGYSMNQGNYFYWWSAKIKSGGSYVRCVKD